MPYHEAANFLFDLRRFSPRPGTEATRELLAHLGDPQESLTAVQIAGSNGKGSTARMLESILREAGLDVGLYTSPHLEDVRERITVNGRKISTAAISTFVEAVEPYVTEHAASGDAPTFFETMTALAVWEFSRRDVDVAILEVGIGGRHDATSVVDPVGSALTSVTLEHTDFLGETIPEIARDKAAVAPDDAALVTAATGEALATIETKVDDVCRVGRDDDAAITVEYDGREGLRSVVSLSGPDWSVETRLPLLGTHQAQNAGVAATLARQVADVTETALAAGLGRATWPGRFEVLGQEPLVVLDGAHNPGGCERVAETLEDFEYDDLHLVVGAMCEKDHRGMATALPAADQVTACEPAIDRAEDEAVLARAFSEQTDATVRTRSDVAGALDDAIEGADPDDAVLVVGSLYAVREARTRWTRSTIPKRVESLSAGAKTLEDAHVTEAGVRHMRGKAAHRVLKTRVQPRQAQSLKEALLAVGGECAISGLAEQEQERADVVMMGTLEQFQRLTARLADQPDGLGPLADQLRDTLGFGPADDTAEYPWSDGTAVMGILNVTPDSFHDGGEYNAVEDALARAEEMIEAGVDIVDVGGESTRPGAEPVAVETERDRVVPVIEALAERDVTVSVDTRKVDVAAAALEAGADILNDVSGLDDPGMAELAAEHDAPVVVMHSIDTPVDPDHEVHYDDVVEDVIDEVTERILQAERAGLDRSQILVDPGLGFGKTPAEDFEILDRLGELEALGCPILVGHSHKSMFGLVGRDADERYDPTVAGTAVATERGADVIRVHDPAAGVAAVDVVEAAADPDAFSE
ncbi:dihydropteroate synthase [Halorhabdus sp. CUG00001]|uniref:dihydropteroate synthase n=1 Tax=Halorhabdus sp. CUG00001 TaxID=2600297 RepID=UPI00131B7208|nr:dihydropteroate synthase [Halorhabdus sp. CUG00001]